MTSTLLWLIRRSDFLLEVCDARFSHWSRNPRLEKRILIEGRRFAIVFNKADAVSDDEIENIKKNYPNAFIVSTKTRMGISELRRFLIHHAKKREITVGVFGYPNSGKSSIINVLKGSHSARTSPIAGFTRGLQKLKVTPRLFLWDTAGVVPFGTNEVKLAILGAKTSDQVKDPEDIAMRILQRVLKDDPKLIEIRYKIKVSESLSDILDSIAIASGKLKKGSSPDSVSAAKMVINDWQKDRLRVW